MKKYYIILALIINQIFSVPTKDDFNKKFINVAENGNPTVVSIISETVTSGNSFFGGDNPFFDDFMPREFQDMFPEHKNRGMSLGSGVIIDKEKGYTKFSCSMLALYNLS